MIVVCPHCGEELDARTGNAKARMRCPGCEGTWVPADVARFSGHTLTEERWVRVFTSISAVLLVLGFLLPSPIRGRGGWTSTWTWDYWERVSGGAVFSSLLPLILGVVAFALVYTLRGRRLANGLAIASGSTLLLTLLFESCPQTFAVFLKNGVVRNQSLLPVLLFLGGYVALAGGNHVRRRLGESKAARMVAGFGAAALAIAFLVPLSERDDSVIEGILSGEAWRNAATLAVAALAILAYAGTGLGSFVPLRDSARFPRLLSVVGRVLLVAVPVAFLIQVIDSSKSMGVVLPLLGSLKAFSLVYGHFLLFGAALAGAVVLSQEKPQEPSGRARRRPARS